MTGGQRVKKAFTALALLGCAFVSALVPELGYLIAALGVSLTLMLYGVRKIIYYCTMARNMVGGKTVLYIGIIAFDIGFFLSAKVDDPNLFITLYILVVHGFSGLVSVLQALEAKRYASPGWLWILLDGALNLIVAILAVAAGLFLHNMIDLAYLFAACLFYSACMQLVGVFRKTAIVYIA